MPSHAPAARRRPLPDAVVPFPAERRTAHVRRCASELDALQGEAARHYWQRVCRELAEELRRLGRSEAELRAAVFAFQDEVQRALVAKGGS